MIIFILIIYERRKLYIYYFYVDSNSASSMDVIITHVIIQMNAGNASS